MGLNDVFIDDDSDYEPDPAEQAEAQRQAENNERIRRGGMEMERGQ